MKRGRRVEVEKISYLLVDSPKSYNSQNWAGPKLRATILFWVSLRDTGH